MGDARFEWLGTVSEEEKLRRLRGADVLAAPSLHGESFGIVLLEGMAAGAAVVAEPDPRLCKCRPAIQGRAVGATRGRRRLSGGLREALAGGPKIKAMRESAYERAPSTPSTPSADDTWSCTSRSSPV